MSDENNRRNYSDRVNEQISEYNERTHIYESIESGDSKPIDLNLMTGQPQSNNNSNNGDD